MKAMNYVYEKLQEIDNFVTQEFEKYVDDLEKTDDIETYVKNFKGLLNYANGELKYFIEDNEDTLFESDKGLACHTKTKDCSHRILSLCNWS